MARFKVFKIFPTAVTMKRMTPGDGVKTHGRALCKHPQSNPSKLVAGWRLTPPCPMDVGCRLKGACFFLLFFSSSTLFDAPIWNLLCLGTYKKISLDFFEDQSWVLKLSNVGGKTHLHRTPNFFSLAKATNQTSAAVRSTVAVRAQCERACSQ